MCLWTKGSEDDKKPMKLTEQQCEMGRAVCKLCYHGERKKMYVVHHLHLIFFLILSRPNLCLGLLGPPVEACHSNKMVPTVIQR